MEKDLQSQFNVITGDGQNKTIHVREEEVTVKGDNNTITVKGSITSLRIIGRENIVITESLKSVVIAGDDNKVTYKEGLNLDGRVTVRSVGKNNHVNPE